MSELATIARPEVAIQPPTPVSMVQWAMQNGASVDQLTTIYELQRMVDADKARNAFNDAMARFKADPPSILKNNHVKHNDFWHATLDECVAKITPALAAVGIRHRWDIDQSKAPQITVTCILSHAMGHSEATPLTASPDTSGAKNAIQAVGSTVTYLQRYTLLAATGTAASGQDDDGNGSGKKPGLAEGVVADQISSINESADDAQLKHRFSLARGLAQKAEDKIAELDFIKAKESRYRQLHPQGGAR